MPALTIGGVDVKPLSFPRTDARSEGLKRTIAGQLRGRALWTKREWTASVYAADDTEAAAIRAVADPATDVAVSGDLVGTAATCRVEVTGDEPVHSGAVWYRMLTLSIREV